ncbi:hypothetical protein GALMADRAFT_241158 [Galerina marginata CBS 339.88]|uniref:Transcription factor BYE1 n=1 Tax=Galerina marginata (strain CBS 339.88) TaxID=685588 RepID=A0A067TC43_GALM3|nr:hypothetical protein GALMADRAFT_241158 [Galerina marginata CBS 339.88]
MSMRSRTRSAGVVGKGAPAAVISQVKPKARSQKHLQPGDMDVDSDDGKENANLKISAKLSTISTNNKKGKITKDKTRDSLRPVDCTCSKGDDGSPMIHCAECKIWYHFTCMDITEPEAEEISVYICPTCTASTRRRSAMTWEGEHAVEECTEDETTVISRRKAALKTRKRTPETKYVVEESEESESSEDEYVEDNKETVVRNKAPEKHHNLPQPPSSESDTDSANNTRKRRLIRKISVSPSPSAHGPSNLKRKATNASHSSPAHKRKRSADDQTTADDPARKYCLGKLEELFRDVFLRYPHVRLPVVNDQGHDMDLDESMKNDKTKTLQKKLDDLSEEEKAVVIGEAHQFAKELESSVFEIYSEPDKAGNPHASGKYKERFRMLQFNLSKVDRVIIHQRITSGNISAKEISLMSSTDLADEETKQSIMLAEQEALEHSILLKSTAPRAKITHKGLQDIEDVNGEVASAHEIERLKEREQEEDERRERERLARLRTVQRQRTASVSVPPESPTVPIHSPAIEQQWGAPPPVPPHALLPTTGKTDEVPSGTSGPPSFLQSPDAAITMEPELNLADLINIDEEQEPTRTEQSSAKDPSGDPALNPTSSPADILQSSSSTSIPTGISPFATRQTRAASFDLSSLWNGPKNEPSVTVASAEPPAAPSQAVVEESAGEGSDKDDAMELESVEANDQDFDMFLEENQPESPSELIVTPIPQKDVESLPQVWTGKITMPLDSSVPQETALIGRQVAGRTLAPDSPLWKTLFPSEQLRIEGRVPVTNSVKYLVQMRMNATKELYAAAFVPASPANVEDFKTFCNFLISKSRHGLVFPWGSRPKDYHPGRELYMIPLLQTDPLPEFVELLDDLKLPKTRSRDYLLGIWILNKGKLAPLPGTLAQSAPPTQPSQSVPHLQTPPANLGHNTPPVSQNHFAAIPNQPPVVAPPLTMPPISTLAAEVASLTPEQLQEVIRTLQATSNMLPLTGIPQLPQQPPPFGQNQGFPPHGTTPPIPTRTPPAPLNTQPWIPPPPGTYMNYPPPNVPFQQPPRGLNSPPQVPYERQDYPQEYDRDFRPGPHYSQGNRGSQSWRGNAGNRGGSRGRGRGGGDGYDRDFNSRRSSDSGWPRRHRTDSQGGPPW